MVMFTPSYTLMQASKLGRGEGGDRSIPVRIVWDSHQGGGGGGGGWHMLVGRLGHTQE